MPSVRVAAPPPYSWTRLRTLVPSGDTTTGAPSPPGRGSTVTTTWRPPSSGRDSTHATRAPSAWSPPLETLPAATWADDHGDGHHPATGPPVVSSVVMESVRYLQ